MLTAYVDETGQEQKDWMFVAGFVGNDDQWQATATAWKEAIAPRSKLHMNKLRFNKHNQKMMLERAAAVTKDCGLTPVLGGVRPSDYEDMITRTYEEKLLNGYIACVFPMVMNTLRGIPADERLEVIFERQDRYWWMTEIAMRVISEARDAPDMLLPDGRPKLANWRSVPKGSTSLLEPADYFCYALLQGWRNKDSLRAQWTKPILDAHGNEGLGAIMRRNKMRQVVQHSQTMYMFQEAKRMMEKMRAPKSPEFENFSALTNRLSSVPKTEIDKRHK